MPRCCHARKRTGSTPTIGASRQRCHPWWTNAHGPGLTPRRVRSPEAAVLSPGAPSEIRAKTPWRVLVLLMAVTGIGALGLNILAPAIPGLARAFRAEPERVQLTITLFLVGMAFSQMVLGAL